MSLETFVSNPIFTGVGGFIAGLIIGFIIGFLIAFFKYYWKNRYAILSTSRK